MFDYFLWRSLARRLLYGRASEREPERAEKVKDGREAALKVRRKKMTNNMKKAITVLSLAGFLFAGAALATRSYAEMTDYGFLGAVTDQQRAEQYNEGTSVGKYVEPDYWGTEFGKVDMDQNYKKAEDEFERAIEIDPKNFRAWYFYGRTKVLSTFVICMPVMNGQESELQSGTPGNSFRKFLCRKH